MRIERQDPATTAYWRAYTDMARKATYHPRRAPDAAWRAFARFCGLTLRAE